MPELIPELKPIPLPNESLDVGPTACQCHADTTECQCEADRPATLAKPMPAPPQTVPRFEFPLPAVEKENPVPYLAVGLFAVLLGMMVMFVSVSFMPVVLIFLAFFLPALLPLILVAIGIIAGETVDVPDRQGQR
jgi:hypothetical protein